MGYYFQGLYLRVSKYNISVFGWVNSCNYSNGQKWSENIQNLCLTSPKNRTGGVKDPGPCGRNMLTQSSRHSAWCTQPAWCHSLHAAAPDIRWSDLQSSRLHLPQPSGCRSDGHKESGRLCGISSKRRTLFGGINSMFPRAPEKYRLTLQMSGVWGKVKMQKFKY